MKNNINNGTRIKTIQKTNGQKIILTREKNIHFKHE